MEATHKVDPLSPRPSLPGHVSLLFSWGENARAVALREQQELVIGRAAPADWILEDRSLSRAHARVSLRNGVVTLQDLGSTNGCVLNGTRVDIARLAEGDVAQLGTVELRLCAQTSLPTQEDALSHAAFLRTLTDELTRARLFGRSASVLAMRHAEGATLPQLLRGRLQPLDRLCLYAPTLTLVLLPEQDGSAARRWLSEIEWPNQAPARTGIAIFPVLAVSAEGLISHALDACHKARPGQWLEAEPAQAGASDGPVLLSPCMLRLYDLVARAARATLPVLIQGESGSGKELVARALHDKSPRAKGPFNALSCATIPANLVESVLFGHERGAFTGAEKQARGVFEHAHGGTVFLDEVGELALPAQAALLRVLETRRVVRVGGTREIEVDVRVVAATHRDLAAMVQQGTFREDLMFRLDALTLRVPPLRERRDEILPLAERFLAHARAQWGATADRLSDDASDALLTHPWPGNVRQLKNVIERAAVVCAGDTIELEDLPGQVWTETGEVLPPLPSTTCDAQGVDTFRSLPDRVREFEISIIREALERAQGNQAQAARMLGVPRRTLANKVHAYDLVSWT